MCNSYYCLCKYMNIAIFFYKKNENYIAVDKGYLSFSLNVIFIRIHFFL